MVQRRGASPLRLVAILRAVLGRLGLAWGSVTVGAAVAASPGCSPAEEPSCVDVNATTCLPLYAPTFQNVFERTLKPTCASDDGTCHTTKARQGGLAFEDPDVAYDALTGASGGRARIKPGNARCSKVVVRIEDHGEPWSMPPGKPLGAAERCALEQWIQQGAAR